MNKPPHANTPQGFRQNPHAPALRPGPVAAPVAARSVVIPAPKRTHQPTARVTVRLPDRVELNRATLSATRTNPAGAGMAASAVEIIPPRRGASNQWLLDTRPTATARLNRTGSGSLEFKSSVRFPAYAFPAGRSKRVFAVGPELMEQVCVTLPATEVSPARSACEVRGTGVFLLLPV